VSLCYVFIPVYRGIHLITNDVGLFEKCNQSDALILLYILADYTLVRMITCGGVAIVPSGKLVVSGELRVGMPEAICYKALKFYLLIWMKASL
jgi:hypothetical protein